jgi:hypothetical protein
VGELGDDGIVFATMGMKPTTIGHGLPFESSGR